MDFEIDPVSFFRDGSRIFLRRGTPLRNDVTDWWGKQILKRIRRRRLHLKEGGGEGVRTSCTLPLDPPLFLLQLVVVTAFSAELSFLGEFSRFFQIQQSPQSATIHDHDVATDLLDETKSDELYNDTSLTKSLQDEGTNASNLKSDLKRRSSPCELENTIRWNDCLGR